MKIKKLKSRTYHPLIYYFSNYLNIIKKKTIYTFYYFITPFKQTYDTQNASVMFLIALKSFSIIPINLKLKYSP